MCFDWREPRSSVVRQTVAVRWLMLALVLTMAACTPSTTASSNTSRSVAATPGTSPVPTQTSVPTRRSTPPRTSRVAWPAQVATASDVISRLRSAGLQVEPQAPSSSAVYGAERLDQFLVGGVPMAIYTFVTAAASERVLDDVANGRTTVDYLRTPYFVQIANLLAVILTDDPNVARTLIAAINRA